jgi:hypothetical protein
MPPDSGLVDLDFSERTIHNMEAFRKFGLLSEEQKATTPSVKIKKTSKKKRN